MVIWFSWWEAARVAAFTQKEQPTPAGVTLFAVGPAEDVQQLVR